MINILYVDVKMVKFVVMIMMESILNLFNSDLSAKEQNAYGRIKDISIIENILFSITSNGYISVL